MAEKIDVADFQKNLRKGQLSILDKLPWGDSDVGSAISTYLDTLYMNKQTRRWARTVHWVENYLFGLGHHYIANVLSNRLVADSNGTLSISADAIKNIPQPVNDILGRYIETNIALLTENRPIPRVTPISDNLEDIKSAELSELTINYLWEELNLADKHREIARQILYSGTAWLEVCYDPLVPRYLSIPKTKTEPTTPLSTGLEVPVPREVPEIDPRTGQVVLKESVEYGDITANVVSGFEMHFPTEHYWDSENLGWVMREQYLPLETIKDKFLNPKVKNITTKKNGYFLENLESVNDVNLTNIPLWWWERLTDLVEGPTPTLFASTPETWDGYIVMRILDRKPSPLWPKGRTVITVGDKVIYDSPKDVGARAFHPKFPHRWHPYIRYRWEGIPGSPWGRSMVGKLLPCIKRINSIDTVLIMWRRTVPIASWIMPRGTSQVEDIFSGVPGSFLEYDPRRTNGAAPQVVYPPAFPETALRERDMMLAQMEAISGVEQVLRGERPVGATCWVEGSYLTNSNGVPCPVEDIKVGDYHMSRLGEGPVGIYHKNEYSGKTIKIYSSGNLPVEVTETHKFPVIDFSEVFNPSGRRKQKGSRNNKRVYIPSEEKIITKLAKDIHPKDCLLSGFIRPKDEDNKLELSKFGGRLLSNQKINTHILPNIVEIDDDLLWLFGLYLAEGHCTKGEIILTINSKDRNVAEKAKRIFEKKFNLSSVRIFKVKDKEAIRVWTGSSALTRVFKTLFETGSRKKKIHEKIFRNHKSLLSLVSGWLDGDGSLDHNTLRGSTRSRTLGSQIRSILLDERIYSPINYDSKKSATELHITGEDAIKLLPFSERYKNVNFEHYKNKGRKGFWIGRYYASYVNNVEEKDYDGYIYNVTMDERSGCENSVNSFGLFTFQSATMLESLRKQALASRSAILQTWDESLQLVGTSLIQETIKHIGEDSRYRERLKVLAREKSSRFQIDEFSGTNLSDNVQVRIDTASEAMISREAKQQRALELIQYGPNLAQIEPGLRAKLVSDLGWPDSLVPQGPDINKARNLIHYIKTKRFDLAIPQPEDDPYVIHEMLVNETKLATFIDLENDVQQVFFMLIEKYKQMIEQIENARMQMQQQMMMQGQGGGQR